MWDIDPVEQPLVSRLEGVAGLNPFHNSKQYFITGLIHVFEVVNIRRGPKNGLTPELMLLLHKMTTFQQKNAKKVKNISVEMQRNRFETYRGRLRFKPKLPVMRSKGQYCSVGKVTRGSLIVNYF